MSAFVLDQAKNTARLRRAAGVHLVVVLGALTLWGAADNWSTTSGLGLAWAVAVTNAAIAGFIIASTLHEWGHYTGARMSGAAAPVLEKPTQYFFMFNYKFKHNDGRQFLWMSLGGILTNWLLVVLTLALIPIDNASRAMLLAVFASRAVAVSMFEIPVVLRARETGQPEEALNQQLRDGALEASRYVALGAGAAVGLAVWAM